jgi:SSS family solute:Na+ symporter
VEYHSFTAWIPTQWLPQWSEFKWGIDARERLTFGNAVIMVFIWYVCSAGSDQMAIQRYLATKDVQSARKTFGVSLITGFISQILLGLVGIAMIAYFVKNPQYLPAGSDINEQADLLFPRFILVGLPIGLSGLIVAGIFAAAMSSLSSGLNSTSSVISEDLLKRFNSRNNTTEKALSKVKIISIIVGIFSLLLSIAVSKVEGNLYDIIVKVVNLFVTPLFVLFFLALFISFATARGTLVGGLFSLIVAIAVAFFGFMGIELLFITPTALVAGIVSGVLASYIDHKVFGNQETVAKRQNRLKSATDKKFEKPYV